MEARRAGGMQMIAGDQNYNRQTVKRPRVYTEQIIIDQSSKLMNKANENEILHTDETNGNSPKK